MTCAANGSPSVLDRVTLTNLAFRCGCRVASMLAVSAALALPAAAQTGHFQAVSTNLGAVSVKSTSAVIPLTLTFDTAGSLGSVTVVTKGVTGLDFADAGGGTCATNGPSHNYVAGDTCTVNVAFSPRFAGSRSGAVLIKTASGNIFATEYLYGV